MSWTSKDTPQRQAEHRLQAGGGQVQLDTGSSKFETLKQLGVWFSGDVAWLLISK